MGRCGGEFFELLKATPATETTGIEGHRVFTVRIYPGVSGLTIDKGKVEYFNLDPDEDFARTRWGNCPESAAIELKNMHEMMQKAFSIVNTVEGLEPYAENFGREIASIGSLVVCMQTPP